jgi:hypothetical protein
VQIPIRRDSKEQIYIEWAQGNGAGFKRTWVQHESDSDMNWAGVPDGGYLNVVRVEKPGAGPAGNATDFPIFSELADEQILVAFVTAVSTITGCELEFC